MSNIAYWGGMRDSSEHYQSQNKCGAIDQRLEKPGQSSTPLRDLTHFLARQAAREALEEKSPESLQASSRPSSNTNPNSGEDDG